MKAQNINRIVTLPTGSWRGGAGGAFWGKKFALCCPLVQYVVFRLTSLLQATKMIFCLRVFYSQTSNLLQLTVLYYYIYFDIFSKIRFETFDIMKCTNKFIRLCINRSEMFRDYIFTVFVIF